MMKKMMATPAKVDQKVPPGALMSFTGTIAGNGGVSMMYEHAPEEKKGKSNDMGYPGWQPRRPDVFSSIEEACHAIVQAAGGNSELADETYDKAEDMADGKKGKAA